jgi:alkylation response protein AidB-like acyl-CoA dehydrogenase
MTIALRDEHLALAAAARRFTSDRCPPAVVRAAVDAEADALPPFWDELAATGWIGLHLPEAVGGEGYGLTELCIVLEELGRAMAPGPALATAWAGAVVHAGAGATDLLPEIATGRQVATVALGDGLSGERAGDGSIAVRGRIEPVLSATLADVVAVPVLVDGTERWCVLRAGTFTVTPVESLDVTRPVGSVAVDGLVPAGDALDGVDRAAVEAIAATLFAAEAAGGASWCCTTAAEYARVREQFGRPIGQFQGVKHRCADMLVAVEQARAVAWDAAAAADAQLADRREQALAAAVAGAIAPDAFAHVAKDCIQVLGGIGFTWEHDAHLYLRRAMAVRQLLGGTAPSRRTVADAALRGERRQLGVTLPPEAEAMRAEVRAFAESIAALDRDAQRKAVVDGGWFVPHWAPPWGRDAGAVEQLVIDEEFRRAKIRRAHLQVGAWAAPTIASHGTPEQQERWVRPTLLGQVNWCQLFSEPGAGSDLAALSTSATRVAGGWSVTGQKVWTSMAKEADWGICLARTSREGPRHHGITYLIVDMDTPGIDIRPLREMTGLEMFNEVFFDDVFVPDDCVIGEVDGGWALARTTLANERVAMGSGSSFGGGVEALLTMVTAHLADGRLVADPLVLDQIGAIVAEGQTVALLGARSTQRAVTGASGGAEASVRKLLGVEHDQRTQELGLTLLGPSGATAVGEAAQWTFGFLANRCLTIAGGTSEIQRNVIGERLLGLPRDP